MNSDTLQLMHCSNHVGRRNGNGKQFVTTPSCTVSRTNINTNATATLPNTRMTFYIRALLEGSSFHAMNNKASNIHDPMKSAAAYVPMDAHLFPAERIASPLIDQLVMIQLATCCYQHTTIF